MEDKIQSLVSVIMPVFNACQYVGKAIQSILEQTYRNFELILIDDGASDGSGKICDEYALLDSRITVIHQKNRGICSARNRGLDLAKGKYIAFCDHDDIYDTNFLSSTVEAAERECAQLTKATFTTEKWNGGVCKNIIKRELPNEKYALSTLINQYQVFDTVKCVIWNGLYLREIIERNKIRFDETIKYGTEDYVFNTHVLAHVQTVVTISDMIYTHYERFEQSTMGTYHPERYDDAIKAAKAESELLSKYDNLSPITWVYHQEKYVAFIVSNMAHPQCELTWNEKRQKLSELKRQESFRLQCRKVYCFKLFLHSCSKGIVSVLFNIGFYDIMLAIFTLRRYIS